LKTIFETRAGNQLKVGDTIVNSNYQRWRVIEIDHSIVKLLSLDDGTTHDWDISERPDHRVMIEVSVA
jgi:hypothetical protein